MYSSTLSLTSALDVDGVGVQRYVLSHGSDRLAPYSGVTHKPSVRRLLTFHQTPIYTIQPLRHTIHFNFHKSSPQTSSIGPFDPFRLHSYSCSHQRFFGLPIFLLPCGLQRYDFKGIRFCGILCKCRSQLRLYSSIFSSMPVIRSSRRMQSFVLWS